MGNKLTIENGRQYFWQWDVGQRLVVAETDCREVHFFNGGEGALTVDVYSEGETRYVNVPDILLQNARGLEAFLYVAGENEAHTLVHQHIDIRPRPQPLEYACTPTEILSWRTMDAKMKELLEEISKSDYTAMKNSLEEISNELAANTRQHGEMEEDIAGLAEAMENTVADITDALDGKVNIGFSNVTRYCSTDEEISSAMEEFFQAAVDGGITCFSLAINNANVSYPFHMGKIMLVIFRDNTVAGDFGLCMLVDSTTSLGNLVCNRNQHAWDKQWKIKGLNGYTPVRGTDYWTEADKAEMVRDVIAALPVYNGEVL